MDKIFPPMYSKPEKIMIFAAIPCWIWVFILLPMFMPFLGLGLWEQESFSVWLEIGYHAANGILLFFLMFSYLKEEWFMVTTDVLGFVKHVLLTVGLIVAAELILIVTFFSYGFSVGQMLQFLPAVEMSVTQTPLLVIDLQPIIGAIVLSVFAPISICALYYCPIFAPICYKKPWAAYLCIAAVALIPAVIDILWRSETEIAIIGYIVRLPIHLLACWSYQKTDNAWTPLVSLAITNLLASIILPLFLL